MIDEYENILLSSDNPKEKLRAEDGIAEIKELVEKYRSQLASLQLDRGKKQKRNIEKEPPYDTQELDRKLEVIKYDIDSLKRGQAVESSAPDWTSQLAIAPGHRDDCIWPTLGHGGIAIKGAVEILSGILDRYLSADLDYFSHEAIASTIMSLEDFRRKYSNNDSLRILLGLVSNIISELYIARGHATPNLPRPLEYYRSMNSTRMQIENIKSLS